MGVKRWLVGLVAAGSMLGLAGVSVAPAVAGELAHERLAGPSGVETSLAVAKHTWGTTWPVVYVASNRNPVDALPAATIGDGPVVLTDGKSLNLGGVKPGKIVLLGGIGAVPQAIEDQAKGQGVEVVRLAGADRNATAVAIAKQWVKVNGTPKNVYVTKNVGSGSPDAVAASVLRDGPILTFTNDASAAALPGVISELKAGKVTALGGGAVVSDTILNTAAGGKATARLAGANRYETAFAIAKYAKAQKSGSVVYLASGTALKDAMVAGAAKDGVILLAPGNGHGMHEKITNLGGTKVIAVGGTGALWATTVRVAVTGELSADDMSLAEMRQFLPVAGSEESVPENPLRSGSYDYCLGNSGASLYFTYDAVSWPQFRFPEPVVGSTAQEIVEKGHFDRSMLEEAQSAINEAAADESLDATTLNGWGSFWAFNSKDPQDNASFYGPSQCRKGAEHPEWTKPFPVGKRFEHIDPDGLGSYTCGASGGTIKCFYWGEAVTNGDSSAVGANEANPGWWHTYYDPALYNGSY